MYWPSVLFILIPIVYAHPLNGKLRSPSGPVVDLGYEIYEGFINTSTGLNTFKGIRYAAPPTGDLRWQPPQPPAENRSSIISATNFASRCPQANNAAFLPNPCPDIQNAATLPKSCVNDALFQSVYIGSEDCLFLNVYAPPNATRLPVLVWIHGGGYGSGDGTQDLSTVININNNSFIGVAIQYRLAAFGFLSSDEVYRRGTVNAGLLDQHFALQWVQSYIDRFGGDSRRVTISGESAGAGSVMLQDLAYGGTLGSTLFTNSIVASPYLPMQYGYADWEPSQSYYAFAQQVGCFNGFPFGNASETIFDCLVGKDSLILQQASAIVSASGVFGTWAFLPVTDGTFLQYLPSQQLQQKKVNGLRILSGNNANEGPFFVPQNINTEDDLVAWIQLTFPLFVTEDISSILNYYKSSNVSVDQSQPKFSTSGDTPPTAINESDFATGQQQRAFDIYAETTFVCPSIWLAEAYSASVNTGTTFRNRVSYKYQFSAPPANHGDDVNAFLGTNWVSPDLGMFSPDFSFALMRIWGNFVTNDNPSIDPLIANGVTTGNSTARNPINDWPPYSIGQPHMINLNQSGGTPATFSYSGSSNGTLDAAGYTYNGTKSGGKLNVTDLFQFLNGETDTLPGAGEEVSATGTPVMRNAFTLVDASAWEGSRNPRCGYWKSRGLGVPE